MAVGLNQPSKLLSIKGIRLATAEAGIRYADRKDLLVLEIAEGARSAAVFTQNKYCAAPVVLAKQHLHETEPRALLINSGNANAGTGQQGMQNARASCGLLAERLAIEPNQVLPFSTGVIGEQLAMDRVQTGIQSALGEFSDDNWLAAAKAIMTTDTIAKGTSEQLELDGETISITGIAKGSGMICPNMATMLAYVATDADISKPVLIEMLKRANHASFNRITVDGDTSTNDALVLIATGQSGGTPIESLESDRAEQFYATLERLLISLATAIIRDAEGATKFVKVSVLGTACEADARAIAYSVAHSPLVKTALFASDPNWGRILAAVGKAPVEQLEIKKVDLRINGQSVILQGNPDASYTETIGQNIFQQAEIEIEINLNLANEHFHVWTSDLSHDYVSINADYRS